MSKSSAQGACPGDEQAVPEDVPPKTPRTDGSAVLESSPCSTPRKVNGRGRKRRLSLSLPKGAGAGAPAPAPTPQEGGAGAIVPPASEDDMDDSEDDNDISFTQISDSVDSTGGQPSSTVGVFSELGFSQGEPTSPLPAPIIDRVVPAGGAASGSLFSQESIVQFPSPSLAGLQSPTYLSLGSRMSMDGSATGGSQEQVTNATMGTVMSLSASPSAPSAVMVAMGPEIMHPIVQPISAVSILSPGENVPLTTPTWPTFGPGVHERVQRAAVHMQQRGMLGLPVVSNPSLESSDDLLASLPCTSGD